MSELGSILRQTREDKQISLDYISETTKIRKRYLLAIEEGEFDVMPGAFYARAFVKTYADSIGLDAVAFIEQYKHELPLLETEIQENVAVSAAPIPSAGTLPGALTEQSKSWGTHAIVWSFVILLGLLIYILTTMSSDDSNAVVNPTNSGTEVADDTNGQTDSTEDDTDQVTEPSDSDTTDEIEEPEQPVEPVKPATTLKLVKTEGVVDFYEVSPNGTHTMLIKKDGGPLWAGVYIGTSGSGTKLLVDHTFKLASEYSFPLTSNTYINLGRADKATVTIDGVLLNDGNAADTKKIQLLIKP